MNLVTIRRVFRLSIALVILWSVFVVFGCNRGPANAGKYVNEKNAQDFTELKSDGTFLVHQGNMSVNGKYAIDGKKIKLTLTTGDVLIGSIEGRTITDNEGKLWTKH